MNDRELLELAAKAARAAGINVGEWYDAKEAYHVGDESNGNEYWWVPLENYGDAMRLAIALNISINLNGSKPSLYIPQSDALILLESTDTSVVCLAIVRAAAEIGEAMP